MTQTNLMNWELIQSKINQQKRINWVELFGTTLTDKITSFSLKGISSDNIYKMLKAELIGKNVDDPEIFRRLQISVAARCGEQKAHKNRMRKY